MKNINHTNITRIKNITNKEGGKAYLDLEYKEFTLHFPDRMKNNILDTQTDELVILYQKINGKRCLTHLVQPIDNERIEESGRENFRFGRIVKNIAFTNEENKIPFDQTKLSNLDFRNRGWGNAVKLKSIIDTEDLEPFQIEIWNKFRPFFDNELNDNPKNYQEYFNDELETDFETQEGKLLFREHRIRERDSWITYKKKQNALKENKFYCEVCNFSFINIYGQEYIECHHIVPINEGERVTRLEDLALICSKCHRMLHRKINDKYLSIPELKTLIENNN